MYNFDTFLTEGHHRLFQRQRLGYNTSTIQSPRIIHGQEVAKTKCKIRSSLKDFCCSVIFWISGIRTFPTACLSFDQILINCWSNIDQIPIKCLSNIDQVLIHTSSNTDQLLIKCWSNADQVLITIWSSITVNLKLLNCNETMIIIRLLFIDL